MKKLWHLHPFAYPTQDLRSLMENVDRELNTPLGLDTPSLWIWDLLMIIIYDGAVTTSVLESIE